MSHVVKYISPLWIDPLAMRLKTQLVKEQRKKMKMEHRLLKMKQQNVLNEKQLFFENMNKKAAIESIGMLH